jgi:hypothetical protein
MVRLPVLADALPVLPSGSRSWFSFLVLAPGSPSWFSLLAFEPICPPRTFDLLRRSAGTAGAPAGLTIDEAEDRANAAGLGQFVQSGSGAANACPQRLRFFAIRIHPSLRAETRQRVDDRV